MSAAVQPEVQFNPFPGLRPFEPDEDYLFFGRERQTDELLRKLRTTRFLSILGTSGSGKSSLVRSGMIPSLYGGGMSRAGSRWRVAIMRPGEDPLGNLAAALSAPEALGSEEGDEHLGAQLFETTLRASKLGLIECIQQARIPKTENVLVLIDQFEELFRYKRSRRLAGRDDAVALVKLLLSARRSDVACYIALTMRSEFVGDCMEFGDLPEVINDGIYLVPRMTRDELKSAITGPVAVGGATIAPRLVSRLLNDVGDDPDQLPILQHALMRTWNCWEAEGRPGEPLDLRQYEEIGTMRTALSRHAEEAFAELDAEQQKIAEKLFKTITDKGTDVRGVRRPAQMNEICAVTGAPLDQVAHVVETFRKPGRSFLTPPAGVALRSSSIIDISHESLMRIWTHLSAWVEDEARAAQLYLGVARAAEKHEEGVAALWRDPELQLALNWRATETPTEEWAARYDPSFRRAMAFLDASQQERDREAHAREQRRRRELRLARALVVILSTATLLTLALGAFAYSQKNKALTAEHSAEQALARVTEEQRRAEHEKQRAEQEATVAQHERATAEHEKQRAEQQTQIATEQKANAETQRKLAEASSAVAQVKEAEARAQRDAANVARGEAIKEQQRAVTSETETRRLGYLAASRALALEIPQQKDQPKERLGLLALEAYQLHRENRGKPEDRPDLYAGMRAALESIAPAATLRGDDSVRAMALAPDGRTAFAGSDDGKVLRFDLGRSGKPSPFDAIPKAVRSVAVNSAGDMLAVGSADGNIRLFGLGHAAGAPRDLPAGAAPVTAVAFQPGGAFLASGSLDGSVKLWNASRSDAPPAALSGTGGKRVLAVAFSRDGRHLAAGLAQGGALLWSTAQPSAAPRAVCDGLDVRSLAFRPDGSVLACGGGRGQIVQVALSPNAAAPAALSGHGSSVNALSFDASGDLLASASSDGTVRIWDAKNPGVQPTVLRGHDSWVWSVAFTPKGDRLVSAGEDRTVRIWPARTDVLAADLCTALKGKSLTEEEWHKYMPATLPYRKGAACP